jgi:site-specific DNA-methyltransferase (adenine-specific)
MNTWKNNGLIIYKEDFLKASIDENSIDLIVTSPPYNVDIQYGNYKDGIPYDEYLKFSKEWITQALKVLKSDGRMCLNIPLDKNKGGQKSVAADFTKIAKDVGFNYHSTIIWNEGNISRRTAWGSWLSARAPYVIAPVEVILVLYKNSWRKLSSGENDIIKQEFMDWTNGVWTFQGESKKRVGHPAPFPIELPRRCIKLFSYVGDIILDPFLGSGSTLIAAYQNKRKGVGVEIDQKYFDLSIKRITETCNLDQLTIDSNINSKSVYERPTAAI